MMERKEYRLPKDAGLERNSVLCFSLGLVALCALPFLSVSLWQEDITTNDLLLFGTVVMIPIVACLYGFFFWNKHEHRAIAVDAEGIEALDPNKPEVRLQWSDINAISSHPLFPCIRLHRSDGHPPFLLSHNLEGGDEVLQLLLQKAPLTASPCSFPVLFRKTVPRPVLAILGLSLVLAIFFGFLGGTGSFFAVNGAVGAGSLHFFCTMSAYLSDDRLRLVITPTEFQLHQRQHISTTAFSTVTAVELRPTSDLSQAFYQPAVVVSFSYAVVVSLSNGETLDMCPFGCDPFTVYQAVRTGWEQSR